MRRILKAAKRGQEGQDDAPDLSKQDLEINPQHAIMVRLQTMRKENADLAVKVAEQVLDNARVAAGLLEDPANDVEAIERVVGAGAAGAGEVNYTGRGSVTVKVDPWPTLLWTETAPPWASTMALTRLRPRPRPRCERLRSPRKRRSQMREVSSGGMPMPVSVTSMIARLGSQRVRISTRPSMPVYLSALSRRLAKTWRMRMRSTEISHVSETLKRDGDALFFGDVLVEFDDFAKQRGHVDRVAGEFHHAGLGFGDVEQRVEHGEDTIGFLDGIGERLAELRDLRVAAQGDFGGAAQARQRRAEVVGDVIEGFTHAANERLVFVEHGIEEAGEFIEFVVGFARRNTGVEVAGADDGLGGGNNLAQRARRIPGEERAAGDAEQDDGRDDADEAGAERFEEEFVVVGAAPDFQDRAIKS
jgi:hypothetical protein